MANSLFIGVNLAGAEFGSNVPGSFGTDYTYPTHAEIDYYASKGLTVIRLPFLWERLQRSEFGALDPTELSRLDDVVNYATSKGPEDRDRAARLRLRLRRDSSAVHKRRTRRSPISGASSRHISNRI